jgi:prolyl oligopeptidase
MPKSRVLPRVLPRALPAIALLTSAVLAIVLARPAVAADDDAPAARRTDTIDRDFGLSMPDPYRWMEGENNKEFTAWLQAQGKASRGKLDALPTLAAWRERLAGAAAAGTRHGMHKLEGDRLFFLRSAAGKERKLMVRGADGVEHTIYDPTTEAGGASIAGYSVAPGGGKVAVNITRGGNEVGEIAILDTTTGKPSEKPLAPVWSEFTAQWLPDGSGVLYTRMRDDAGKKEGDDPMQGMASYLHRLGKSRDQDILLARAGAKDALNIVANDFPSTYLPQGSKWGLLTIGGARASFGMCATPAATLSSGHPAWRCIVDTKDNIQSADVLGDTLYLLQAGDTPNRRLLSIDLSKPDASLADAQVLVAQRPDTVLSEISVARDAMYVKVMRKGLDGIERMDYATHALQPVPMPAEGSIYLMRTDPRQDGALLSLEGWTLPRKVYRYEPASAKLVDTGLGALGEREYPGLVAEETEATSADGTRVPLSLVYPKDLPRDGSARAIVFGYGGYGISMQPAFAPDDLEWAKAGNVFATCHVRGGGENGDAWRIAGTGPNKQRGIEDFIACAKELAARGLSTPARTAGFSGSMGGILSGGAYTTAPDAWGAMVVQSGMFNPTRILSAKNGANQLVEIGDPRTEGGMRQLLAMDPYQHVKDGTAYPPLLLVVGLVDQRVPPSESGKFGARVMAANPKTPVVFRTDAQFGHFATSANEHALEMADMYAFLDAYLATP